LNNWRNQSTEQVHTDITQQTQNLTLAIFGFIGFDYDLETLNGRKKNNELTEALRYVMSLFEIVSLSPRTLGMIYLKLNRRYQKSQTIIDKYLNQMAEKELNENPESRAERKRTCLIASLVASLQKDEKVEAMKNEEDKKGKNFYLKNEYLINYFIGLSRSEMINETLLFLVAGYETTSTALSWFIHLMSKNPRVQQKIKAELMKDSENQQLTLDRLDSLVYLDCVIKEVLRLSPPAYGTLRTVMMNDRLPESGEQLHKGDGLLILFHNLTHDTRYWSIDPNIFYPERFLNEDKDHQSYAYLPFGSGHRQCIGKELAQFELKLIAARLMQYVTFGDGGSELNAGGHLTGVTIMPRHVGVTINFDL
jgi:cytochrome P450